MIIQRKINDFKLTLLNKNKNINFSIDCNENDKFKEIEDKFIEKYPDFSNFDLNFRVNEKSIKRHKVLKDNKIQNNDNIIVDIEE